MLLIRVKKTYEFKLNVQDDLINTQNCISLQQIF